MYKNSKLTIIMPVIIASAIVLGALMGSYIFRKDSSGDFTQSRFKAQGGDKLNMLLSLIENRYVDSVNLDSISEKIIPIFLEELDPHSVYIPVDKFADANESLDGQFDGIGVMFNMATDTVIILSVIQAGPSSKVGIENGDRIIKINDTIVAGVKMDQNDVIKRLKGPRGTKVNLGIQRQGIKELIPITVTRGVVPVTCIMASYMVEPGVGYIMFSKFSRNAHDEIMSAIKDLRTQGMKSLILDMRGNSGGFLDQAITISNEFLPAKSLIVYTEDRDINQVKQYSNGKGQLQDLDLVVLIDEGSASSSEILAGALQDNDRGTIIGRRSFGKGLVQEQIPFSDGSAVWLTVAKYFTPTGRSIQKPYGKGNGDYRNELITRYEHSELFSADSIHFDDSLKFITPGGRTVYGGGGIMPDIFIGADTTDITPYFREVSGKNIIYRFTIGYADRHRAELNKINNIEQLNQFWKRNSGLLDEFVSYAAKEGVAPKQNQIETSKHIIMAQLKAYIGRNTKLEEVAFYYSIKDIDNVIDASLKAIKEHTNSATTNK